MSTRPGDDPLVALLVAGVGLGRRGLVGVSGTENILADESLSRRLGEE